MRANTPYRRPFTAELAQVDARLALLGRGFAGLRLRLGEGLLHLETIGGFKRLGFPTFESYAREALGRTGRWASDVRALARRLADLPLIRAEVLGGRISLSMAELVARVATPEDEREWLVRAATMNIRQMRAELQSRRLETFDESSPVRVSIAVTVDKVEAWAFERARLMVEAVGAQRGDEAIEAILAEGLGELLARDGDIDLPSGIGGAVQEEDERAWRMELAEICERAQGAVEAILPNEIVEGEVTDEVEWAVDIVGVDRQLREQALVLARRDVELGGLAARMSDSGTWQTIGYASFDHYCRERIGLSPSSVATRIALVRRLAGLAQVEAALVEGRIGYEAAALVARVCGRTTEAAWVARAADRTVKLLRDEIDAVEMVARVDGLKVWEVGPPDQDTMADMHALERGVIAAVVGQSGGGQMSGQVDCQMSGQVEGQLSGQVEGQMSGQVEGQMSGDEIDLGTTTLRFAVTAATGQFWKALERVHAGVNDDPSETFVGFLVRSVMKSWSGLGGAEVAYGDVYLRDRWRCASPVCRSRHVTPHHVKFRSHGGGEGRDNLVSLCEVCHLELIHGGQLEVRGAAPIGLAWKAAGWAA